MKRTKQHLSVQIKNKIKKTSSEIKKKKEYVGETRTMISTGSTLLDLAISGGRIRGGGIPGGIFVEVFGPSGTGKTVLLCEIAGAVQRLEGNIMFHDPEARLNKQFAKIFGLNINSKDYSNTGRIPEVFGAIRKWQPRGKKVNGIFTDSLAALSTDFEMDNEEGDKMGMRRAKEFSEELRKTARIITEKDLLLVCSNQVRINIGGNTFGPKYTSPGGEAIAFYASLRLQMSPIGKLYEKAKVAGKDIKRAIGIRTEVKVVKSSIWKPYNSVPITILFDYGIDDIRENLQYIKDYTNNTVYYAGNTKLSKSLKESITIVEEEGLESILKEAVIDLWEDIDSKFKSDRKKKQR